MFSNSCDFLYYLRAMECPVEIHTSVLQIITLSFNFNYSVDNFTEKIVIEKNR